MNLATLTTCAICRHALTKHRDRENVVFRHPVADHSHEAVPVEAGPGEPVFDRCHTCTGASPVWAYQTGVIGIAAIGGDIQTYNDRWHVCYRCSQFLEAGDVDALTAHCAGLMHWPPGSDQYTILNTLHQGIVLSSEGRTLLTTTDWTPARLTAEMLPKIRDRFTGLLRGPSDLPEPINGRGHRNNLADELDRTVMYWINHEFADVVSAVNSDQPVARITDNLMPSKSGLIAWPEPVGANRDLAAVSWTPLADGWQILGYRSIGAATDQDLMEKFRHEIGWLVPIHAEHVTQRAAIDGNHPLSPLVTTWLLIKQQIAEAVPARLPNGITKAYRRHNRPAPEVRTVRIKPRNTSRSTDQTSSGNAPARAKPDHRFWVSGHERMQAHGQGRSLRTKIDIEPFLKGDEDLPIKLSTTVRILGSRTFGEDAAKHE
ncbi:hypothetical protein FB565_000239 [Actinoplanes lutulentus]|uniref:Uncharacterized protein n=1 Tax=Actinoplanes lutulentus TaxID=1287878 RepID=A0A327YVW6_9ACTN|nr:hypothetical protein [Actinoplanes lutulentus]MBB2940535.1 hypothetical protein [Actinoplanes lutulentus]RAK24805.1 hypothetical protein B0I29_13511 [Actinoplanes lutulentus]